ncbi:MAG TPA: nicotinate-nucleotide adenylyltransferase [Pyrinomonadaceae bacterium]|jgi:nicotinate-nucleotide adenylyltransferase
MKRIALYGGTFDPVHAGHIAVARELKQLLALDEVLFIPAHVAPHKRGREVTPAFERYAMLALATQNEPRLMISTVELDEPAKPYTIETLVRMQSKLGPEAQLFFVMGADSWVDIKTWREWERVLELTNHVVVTRPGYELSTEHVTPAVRERVVDLRGLEREAVSREVDGSEGTRIYVTDVVLMDVSSTEIRQLVRDGLGREAAALLPAAVAEFIGKYKLYRKN